MKSLFIITVTLCCIVAMTVEASEAEASRTDIGYSQTSQQQTEIAKLKRQKQKLAQERVAAQRSRKWNPTKEAEYNRKVKEINSKLKKLGVSTGSGTKSTKQQKIDQAKRDMQALENKRATAKSQKRWTAADEANYKVERQKIQKRLKNLGASNSSGTKSTKQEKIQKTKRDMQALESKRAIAKSQKRWTAADEANYKVERQKIQKRLKDLGAG